MKKILVIEDDEVMRNVLKEQLALQGFLVFDAINGKEGLNLALSEHPNLIILDLLMPVMSGVAMLDELRKDSWGKNAKVIVLTNMPDTGKIKTGNAKDGGVYSYITKTDIQIDDLVGIVNNALNSE